MVVHIPKSLAVLGISPITMGCRVVNPSWVTPGSPVRFCTCCNQDPPSLWLAGEN